MTDYRILIAGSALDIPQRIKEIDENYFVVFNVTKKRLEVHNSRQRPDTLAVVLPYDTLDNRAVMLTRKTRVENILKQLAEIEAHNKKIEEESENFR